MLLLYDDMLTMQIFCQNCQQMNWCNLCTNTLLMDTDNKH